MDSTQQKLDSLIGLLNLNKSNNPEISNEGSTLYLIVGLSLILIGFLFYIHIWRNNKSELPDSKNWIKSIPYLVSFTPSGNPIKPIVAGITTTLGIGTTIGYFVVLIVNLLDFNFIYHSRAIAISSSFFSICIALITFWTLNQTKKIDHQQGHKITEFNTLIQKLNHELEKIIASFRNDYKYNWQEFHRVYFITNHPFFGTMSYQDEKFTNDFLSNLRTLRDFKRRKDDKKNRFEFHILCNDGIAIRRYIEDYYASITPEETRVSKIEEEVNEFEQNIKDFEELMIAERFPNIPDFPQFMIIGNTVFEFIIQAATPVTQIIETQVITDKKRCKIYINTFELLRNVLRVAPPQGNQNPIAQTNAPSNGANEEE